MRSLHTQWIEVLPALFTFQPKVQRFVGLFLLFLLSRLILSCFGLGHFGSVKKCANIMSNMPIMPVTVPVLGRRYCKIFVKVDVVAQKNPLAGAKWTTCCIQLHILLLLMLLLN